MTAPLVRTLDSARHPFELFVLWLGLVVGFPLLWGAPAPGTTSELLGPVAVHVWAWMLVGGCLIALLGAWWTWWAWLSRWIPKFRPALVTALLIERVGLVSVGAGTLIYVVGVVAKSDAPPGRYIPAGLVLGLGLASFWRAGQIQRWIRATSRNRSR